MGHTSPLNYSESTPPGTHSSLVFFGGSGIEEVWSSADSLPTVIVRSSCSDLSSVSICLSCISNILSLCPVPKGGGEGGGSWNLK